MCGIYGIVDLQKAIDPDFLIQQNRYQIHRGPDDTGIWISKSRNVGLAHLRLSILDLSAAGHQPMLSDDNRYAIVYNGEVYNFWDIRTEMEKSGIQFKTRTDTEVVLNAYILWGEDCIKKFNGMFAFAIYDSGNSTHEPSIFFARDRAGKKPFYYCTEANCFQFASELKALSKKTSLDVHALNFYLALGYVPYDLCLAQGVKKLPPAHAGRLMLNSLDLKIWKYWELPAYKDNGILSGEEIAEQVEKLLVDSVRLRLISDVPFGVFLSGGLDSSLIVAAAAQHVRRSLKTFTIAMTGSKLDEAVYAKKVAEHFDTEHHVLEAENLSMNLIDELAHFIDEPIADSSILPTYMVSKLTRRHVTVALGGDGGDELFGGYKPYQLFLHDEKRLGWIPSGLFQIISKATSYLPAGIPGRNRITSLKGGPLQQLIWSTPYFDLQLRKRLLNFKNFSLKDLKLIAPESWLLSLFFEGSHAIDKMTRTHFKSILPDDFLVKVDRASMAVSLEVRAPYLDYRLIEYAFSSIPPNWKANSVETRRIQKLLAEKLLPRDLDINRKQGFSIPLDDWLRKDNCKIFKEYAVYLPELINKKEVNNLINGQMQGRTNGSRLFNLLMLAIAIKNNNWS